MVPAGVPKRPMQCVAAGRLAAGLIRLGPRSTRCPGINSPLIDRAKAATTP